MNTKVNLPNALSLLRLVGTPALFWLARLPNQVWVALWLVAVLIFLSLMTHILSKTLKLGGLMCFFLLGSGFSLVLYSVLCLAELLLS